MTNAKDICIVSGGNEIFYGVRKYAGEWVPAIKVNGVRKTFAHCSTSGGAMETAIREAQSAAISLK